MKITPGHGPASTPAAPALTEPQRRVLHALSAGGRHTVADLAAVLGLHANGVRRHLAALVEAGLVATTREAVRGPGRPSAGYEISDTGRAVLGGAGPVGDHYRAMALAFARHLAADSDRPREDARAIGRTWGGLLAGSSDATSGPATAPPERRARILELLAEIGFSPEPHPDGVVALRTCPLLAAATQHPEVLCEVHLGLVQGVSAAYGGSSDGGELHPFAAPGACLLRLPGTEPGA